MQKFVITSDTQVRILSNRYVELETCGKIIRDYRPGVRKLAKKLALLHNRMQQICRVMKSLSNSSVDPSWWDCEGETYYRHLEYESDGVEEDIHLTLTRLESYFQ